MENRPPSDTADTELPQGSAGEQHVRPKTADGTKYSSFHRIDVTKDYPKDRFYCRYLDEMPNRIDVTNDYPKDEFYCRDRDRVPKNLQALGQRRKIIGATREILEPLMPNKGDPKPSADAITPSVSASIQKCFHKIFGPNGGGMDQHDSRSMVVDCIRARIFIALHRSEIISSRDYNRIAAIHYGLIQALYDGILVDKGASPESEKIRFQHAVDVTATNLCQYDYDNNFRADHSEPITRRLHGDFSTWRKRESLLRLQKNYPTAESAASALYDRVLRLMNETDRLGNHSCKVNPERLQIIKDVIFNFFQYQVYQNHT